MVMWLSKSSCSVLLKNRDKAIHGTIFAHCRTARVKQRESVIAGIAETIACNNKTRCRIVGEYNKLKQLNEYLKDIPFAI